MILFHWLHNTLANNYCYLLPVFLYLNFEIRININIINNENKTEYLNTNIT